MNPPTTDPSDEVPMIAPINTLAPTPQSDLPSSSSSGVSYTPPKDWINLETSATGELTRTALPPTPFSPPQTKPATEKSSTVLRMVLISLALILLGILLGILAARLVPNVLS